MLLENVKKYESSGFVRSVILSERIIFFFRITVKLDPQGGSGERKGTLDRHQLDPGELDMTGVRPKTTRG